MCSSLTRIVVTRKRHDALVEALAAIFSAIKVGDPFEATTQMGPLAMRRQRDRVEGLIEKGKSEGAQLATGGGRPSHLERGFFIEPTVFGNVDNNSTIAREEIFGPVLVIIGYDDIDHAVEIANDTSFGLAGYVNGSDAEQCRAVARRMRTGWISINGGFDFHAPFGGYKRSGNGREWGDYGFHEYVEVKSLLGYGAA